MDYVRVQDNFLFIFVDINPIWTYKYKYNILNIDFNSY
jgi:hypothetical protein